LPGDRNVKCNRQNSCGIETPVLSLSFGRTELLSGEEFKDAVRAAARICSVTIQAGTVGTTPGANQVRQPERPNDNNRVLQSIWRLANEAIKDRNGIGRAYLRSRHFSDDFITSDFGWIGSVSQLKAVVSVQDLTDFGLWSAKDGRPIDSWNSRIVFPAYDSSGILVGLIGRSLDERDDKYRQTKGYKPSENIFGLHRAKQYKDLILAESPLGVLKANQHGIQNIVAAGGTHFGERLLQLSQVERLYSFLDMDEAGQKGNAALVLAWLSRDSVPADLYIGSLPEGFKAPDEYLDSADVESFRSCVTEAPHCLARHADILFDPVRDASFADGSIERYIEQAAEFLEIPCNARKRLRLNTIFIPEVLRLSGISPEDFDAIRAEIAGNRETEKRNYEIAKRLQNIAGQVAERGLDDEILSQLATIKTASIRDLPTGAEALDEIRNYFTLLAERPLIGLPTGLPTIDKKLEGIHKLTLLAGPTNIGKTVLLGQIAAHVAMQADACVLFWSFEMLRREIFARIWSMLLEANWTLLRDIYREPRPERYENILIESGILNNIRIIHPRLDRSFTYNSQTVLEEANRLREATGRERCMVILDFFQSFPPIPGLSALDQDIAQVQRLLEIKDGLPEDDPCLVVSAVRKRDNKTVGDVCLTIDDVMGSSTIGYNCDNILLWNKFSNQMLFENFIIDGGAILALDKPQDIDWDKERKKPDVQRAIREMRLWSDNNARSFGHIEISKGRDGTTKGNFNATVKFKQNQIVEGLEV